MGPTWNLQTEENLSKNPVLIGTQMHTKAEEDLMKLKWRVELLNHTKSLIHTSNSYDIFMEIEEKCFSIHPHFLCVYCGV